MINKRNRVPHIILLIIIVYFSGTPLSVHKLSTEHKMTFSSKSLDFLKSALIDGSKDQIFNIRFPGHITPANTAADLASKVLKSWQETIVRSSFTNFKKTFNQRFIGILENTRITPSQRKKICMIFSSFRFHINNGMAQMDRWIQ